MTARETGAVERLKRELERQKVPFAPFGTGARENVVGIYNSPALDLAALAAALIRPQPAPSATGEIVERLSLHSTWRDSHGELNDAPNIARALIEQQAATIAERDGENERLHIAINDGLHWIARGQVDRAEAVLRATLERTRGQ